MKVKWLLSFIVVVAAVACQDLEATWNAMKNGDPTKGTEAMDGITFGYFSDEDTQKITAEIAKGGKSSSVDYSKYVLRPFTSKEDYLEGLKQLNLPFSQEQYSLLNSIEYNGQSILCRLSFSPFVAKVTKVTLESSVPDIVSFRKTGDILNFYLDVHSVGECDIKVVAEGINRMERTIHLRISAKVGLLVYTDPFWLNNYIARLKYKTTELPKGVGSLYLNVKDSATVIGYTRMIDQRDGSRSFKGVSDTTTYPIRQHTDKFRVGKRIILRNVSDAVRKYNLDKKTRSYFLLPSSDVAESFRLNPEQAVKFTVRRSGNAYEMDIFGQTIQMDKYQVYWINRTVSLCGRWPGLNRKVEKIGDKYYLSFDEPYHCKRVELGLNVIGNSPYLVFDVMMKESQTPSATDDDEDDPLADFRDSQGEVVDSIGTQLKDYFIVTFLQNISQQKKDSLSNVLNNIIKEIPDSTKWQLGY